MTTMAAHLMEYIRMFKTNTLPGRNQIKRKHGSPASAFSPAGSALSPAS